MTILDIKIAKSIETIRKAEKLAKQAGKPLYVAFSGGKDSQVLYHLSKEAGVDFRASWSPTTVDPPEVVRFIKTQYPDVEIIKPKESIYTVAKRNCLPTQLIRWCCAEFKENKRTDGVTMTGVRWAESVKRSRRKELELTRHKFSGTFTEYENRDDAKQVIDRCLGGG